ncbi:MAG: hypothetical protein ACOZNI_34520 [Myxococcota bacterium]
MGSFGLSVLAALAGEAVAVLPGLVGSEEDEIRAALAEVGLEDARLLPPDEFVARIDVVPVTTLPADDCGGPVEIADWRERLEDARGRLQMLDFAGSLTDLVALEVEVVCITAPLGASDLFRLELSVAEAHTFLAAAASGDAVGFHAGEATAALERAAVVGASLAPPADVGPEVLAAYDVVKKRADPAKRPRVAVAGPGARVGARFGGRPIPDGPFEAAAGPNLVQAASGPVVTAAAVVDLAPRSRTLLWLAPGGVPRTRGDVVQQILALTRGGGSPEGRALLAAAAGLFGDDVVYVAQLSTGVEVWRPEGGTLVRVGGSPGPAARPSAAVDRWDLVLGAGLAGGWSDVGGGDLEGLGGARVGPAVWGRVGVSDWASVAIAVHPDAVWEENPEDLGGGTLFRATVPARAGVRVGRRASALVPEAGLDLGWHYFGAFGDVQRMSVLLVGAAGASASIGETAAARVEVYGGTGIGYRVAGAWAGLEWRR